MDTTLAEFTARLDARLDAIDARLDALTEMAAASARERQDRAELFRDAMPIATTLVERASAHLQEVEDYIDIPDLVRLLKKLARQTPRIESMLDQLESVSGLLEIAGPISKDAFNLAETALDRVEKKGYFAFARSGARMLDNVVSSFTVEDVDRLGDNIVLILNVVKNMTQPEIMQFVQNTMLVADQEIEKPVDTSIPALLKQMRDPNVRRGLALTMRVMSVVGAQAAPSKN